MNNAAFLVTKEEKKNTCAAGKVVLKHCVQWQTVVICLWTEAVSVITVIK